MKKIKRILGLLLLIITVTSMSGQVGIKTATPQRTLHVNGNLQITNEFNVGGNDSSAGDAGIVGQVLVSNGENKAPSWKTLAIPTLPDLATGSVIAIDGQLMIAQEMTVQMAADYTFAGATSGNGVAIGNLSNKIIDNENSYLGTSTTNSFTVSQDGVYMVNMNLQLSTASGTEPVIGLWDNDLGNWVARVNDTFTAPTGKLQTYTLITSIPMVASHSYSFRFINTSSITVKYLSSGFTGSGPVSQVTIRRLK